ncbi:beat protein, putative [Ixodes scapularis]|uniref:Beat protein, putative n=2 Tax=Ixodes scapularis TaxID=6945 RepID=B7QKS5_IXOSC|nr:beat protein, putative [Ixodes scapularis]|eukprot:XP_002415780.1 beat protein, putative [Ixodes scapularis]
MKVPSAVIQGRSMWLNCTYDLESDELYSVKWYKNDTEFYRYIPRDRPPAQNYDLPGVVVDMVKSREGNVFVAAVNLSTEGNYRCEASAEAPSFQTVVGEREVKVFV